MARYRGPKNRIARQSNAPQAKPSRDARSQAEEKIRLRRTA